MEKATSSLDDIQDGIDSLILNLFNSVRGYTDANPLETIEAFKIEYEKTMKLIDTMKGNGRPKEEQEQEIQDLQSKIHEVKSEIKILETNLIELNTRCKSELNEILTDQLLRIPRVETGNC